MIERYLTVKEDGQSEIEIKKSRFICSFKRVTTEEEAKTFIQAVKKEHWKANHNCSAFVIGDKSEIQRSSDDGEPSGTAGIPMLEVLKKNELINVVAVVTRYFGGIKLGAGGLIRAYTQAVSHGLTEVGIVEGTLQQELAVAITYPQLGKLENFLELQQVTVKETRYTDQVIVVCMVDETDISQFKATVTELLNGQVTFEKGPISYHEKLITLNKK
ncbi:MULTISPECIES: YigZ family protein [Enterococcus]|uniref:YigZ family protein n=1 Tax=Enterococcus thailandicus TaxID=417368 RepID=A0A179ER63_ENTTH|nr:YigZ family protein [Enterococcus thailandicus]ASZ06946.1 YigZ family protein [Enterococcus thailandicus]MDA3964398.1 YigZ family protein [Enterococcus thailandicus]MDT2751074.1 YigZ family protein [Enterococcus thailandicus]MDT2775599.1 YigZ family protein [Enterococcus thailandicus]MDT2794463.1 YigZ family protein [Enterococcus thailandicus]